MLPNSKEELINSLEQLDTLWGELINDKLINFILKTINYIFDLLSSLFATGKVAIVF